MFELVWDCLPRSPSNHNYLRPRAVFPPFPPNLPYSPLSISCRGRLTPPNIFPITEYPFPCFTFFYVARRAVFPPFFFQAILTLLFFSLPPRLAGFFFNKPRRLFRRLSTYWPALFVSPPRQVVFSFVNIGQPRSTMGSVLFFSK